MASRASELTAPARRSHKWRYLAISATIAGALLIAVSSVYAFWRIRSGSDADHFNYEVPAVTQAVLTGENAAPIVQDVQATTLGVSTYASLYPGGRINPRYWSNPDWAGTMPFGAPGIPAGFSPVSSRDPVAAEAAGAQATRIRIPAIGLDSFVAQLELLDLGDQRAYQTPNNTVGHIPQSVSPGELDTGWYFGHLESLGTGEGNVFNRLPEVSELLRHDPVDVFVETDDAEYMYRVTSTRQVRQEDLEITHSTGSEITLCTCWPPRVYDRRVLVNAELIAVRRG